MSEHEITSWLEHQIHPFLYVFFFSRCSCANSHCSKCNIWYNLPHFSPKPEGFALHPGPSRLTTPLEKPCPWPFYKHTAKTFMSHICVMCVVKCEQRERERKKHQVTVRQALVMRSVKLMKHYGLYYQGF